MKNTIQNTQDKKDIAWQMFKTTGCPAHYLLYKKLTQEED